MIKKIRKTLSLVQNNEFALTPLSKSELSKKLHSKNFFWNLTEGKNKNKFSFTKSIFPSYFYMNAVKIMTRNFNTAILCHKKEKLKQITDPNLFKSLENQIDFIKYHDLYFNTKNIYKIAFDVVKEMIIILYGIHFSELNSLKREEYDIKIINQEKYIFKIFVKKNIKKNTLCSIGTKILFEFGEKQIDEIYSGPKSICQINVNQENYIEFYIHYAFCEMKDLLKGLNIYKLNDVYPLKYFNLIGSEIEMYISDFNFLNKDNILDSK